MMSAEEEILSPDEIEDAVLNILPTLDVSELGKIYTLLELECTEERKGKVPVEDNEVISQTKMDVMKLKDFKISGSIGNVGEKDKLSYTSLVYQIENAKKRITMNK